jgi:hypothetical protein
MLDAGYWLAAALALVGVLYRAWAARSLLRDRVAWALLASAAFLLGTRWMEVPFNRALWTAVDVAAAAIIVWPMVPILFARDWPRLSAYSKEAAIFVLFPLMWLAYTLPAAPAYVFTTIAATAQLLLTLPLRAVWGRLSRNQSRPARWNEFDLMVHA